MALDLRLQQKMVQQLVMTPQLQQAIKLLQLSHLEMAEVLRQELEQNPVLEEGSDNGDEAPGANESFDTDSYESSMNASLGEAEADGHDELSEPTHMGGASGGHDGDSSADLNSEASPGFDPAAEAGHEPSAQEVDRDIDWEAYLDTYSYALPATAGASGGEELPSFESSLTRPTGLLDHLRWQVHMASFTPEEKAVAFLLIDELNDDGYLPEETVDLVAHELGIAADRVEMVLFEVQGFDPLGVGARNLRECLAVQAHRLCAENTLVCEIIDKHLKQVERRNYQAIARALKVSAQEVSDAIKLIAQLEPRPGRIYSERDPQYIVPDIYVHKVGDEYVIVLNEDGLPRLRISNYYRHAMRDSGAQAKSYIQERLRSAAWLIRSIHMRQRTIYRVMESILKFQRDFFDKGVAFLKPLILKDVAEDLEMHESTISRVTTNKYVHTPQGIYELKYFFNSSIHRMDGESIASESVRDHIKRLINDENDHAPLSDQSIVEHLKSCDIDIARRTVAKYREMLKIPSSSKRKRVF